MPADSAVELNIGSGGALIATDLVSGKQYQVIKMSFGGSGIADEVTTANPFPVQVLGTPSLAADAATATNQDQQSSLLSDIANDQATEITLASLLAKIIAAPSTEAKQDLAITALAAILSKLIVAPATEAKQDTEITAIGTGNTSLSSIKTNTDKIPALGQALAGASVPVVLTAAQLVTLTPPAAISGFSTSALQTSGNSSLSSIDGKVPALGQALAAASTPVVLTAAQLTTLTPPAAIVGFNLETTQVAMSAKLPATLGAKTTANSMAVNIASDQTVATSEVAPTTIQNGKTTVTTAGTRIVLATSATVKSVTIKASTTNTGIIYVGNSTVAAANGFELLAGQSVSMDISNLATVFIDASVSGSSVTYISVN